VLVAILVLRLFPRCAAGGIAVLLAFAFLGSLITAKPDRFGGLLNRLRGGEDADDNGILDGLRGLMPGNNNSNEESGEETDGPAILKLLRLFRELPQQGGEDGIDFERIRDLLPKLGEGVDGEDGEGILRLLRMLRLIPADMDAGDFDLEAILEGVRDMVPDFDEIELPMDLDLEEILERILGMIPEDGMIDLPDGAGLEEFLERIRELIPEGGEIDLSIDLPEDFDLEGILDFLRGLISNEIDLPGDFDLEGILDFLRNLIPDFDDEEGEEAAGVLRLLRVIREFMENGGGENGEGLKELIDRIRALLPEGAEGAFGDFDGEAIMEWIKENLSELGEGGFGEQELFNGFLRSLIEDLLGDGLRLPGMDSSDSQSDESGEGEEEEESSGEGEGEESEEDDRASRRKAKKAAKKAKKQAKAEKRKNKRKKNKQPKD